MLMTAASWVDVGFGGAVGLCHPCSTPTPVHDAPHTKSNKISKKVFNPYTQGYEYTLLKKTVPLVRPLVRESIFLLRMKSRIRDEILGLFLRPFYIQNKINASSGATR